MKNISLRLSAWILGLALACQPLYAFAAKDAAHGAEAKSGGLPQLDFSTYSSQIFWLVIAFVCMYMFFAKKTLPDISSTIENRKNHIDADLETADQLQKEVESVQQAYEQNLEAARQNAAKAVNDIEESIKEKALAEYASFRERSEVEIKKTEDAMEQAKIKALDEMNVIAAQTASQAISKIIGADIDEHQALSVVETLTGKAKAA